MDQREIEVVNLVRAKKFDEKKALLKAYFDALTPEKAKWVRTVAQRYKRKADRPAAVQMPRFNQVPPAVGVGRLEGVDPKQVDFEIVGPEVDALEDAGPPLKASKIVAEIPRPWWEDYDCSKIVSLDCEFVSIPRPCEPGRKQRYNNEVAIVGICNFQGNRIYHAKVRRPRGSFHVTYYSTRINGIRAGDLEGRECKELDTVLAEVEEILIGKLVVGHGVAADFRAMKMEPEDFDIFDLQWEYWREDSGQRLEFKLKALYFHFFHQFIQRGIHDAMTDCIATMRIFREKYICGGKLSPANMKLNPEPVPEGMIDPLRGT